MVYLLISAKLQWKILLQKKKQNRYNKVNKSEIEMQKTETSKEVHFEKEKKKKKHKDIKKYEVNKVI